MTLEDLNKKYDELQLKWGDKNLHSIYNGGCSEQPDICFVFMNPTGRNIASSKEWHGIHSPWIGTKNIWTLFYRLNLISEAIYIRIRDKLGKDWDEDFAIEVYDDVIRHHFFITNLGKCTQVDARVLPDSVFLEYRDLLFNELDIIKPKVVILFGNQVSSIVLNKKISVSTNRKKEEKIITSNNQYIAYTTYYPIGNGIFNIDKAIEDISWIIDKYRFNK